MIEELQFWAALTPIRPATIFVGGGTPTLLSDDAWRRLLTGLRDSGTLDKVHEFTVEANPETVTADKLALLVAGGVNRVSVGAQSFNLTHLKTLERWHDPANVAVAVDLARNAGIHNINLDLIFAIPGQTLADVDADLDHALALKPTHVSYYNLTYEANTAMTQRLNMGQFQPIDEDLEHDMFARIIERLADAGFEHYEISNWAKRPVSEELGEVNDDSDANQTGTPATIASDNPYRCQHNLLYWQSRDWLGIGPSASSHAAGLRWKNAPHLGKYLATGPQPPMVDVEALPMHQQVGERLMMYIRLLDGIPRCWLSAHLPSEDARWRGIADLVDQGLLTSGQEGIRLTPKGLFLADHIAGLLL